MDREALTGCWKRPPAGGWDGPVSPLCSRNARPPKGLVGRAQWGTHPSHPGVRYTSKLGKDHLYSLAAALPAEWRVLARRGWVGEKAGLFEHPVLLGPQFHMKDFNVLCGDRVFRQPVNLFLM
jgi:hypothetical protein